MKNLWRWIIPIIISIIGIIIPICWDLIKEDHKELTIQQERKIDFFNTLGNSFDINTKDSLNLKNYCFCEYSIINTGNKTIVGYGANSDILTEDNGLCIAPDSVIINLCFDNNIAKLNHNHIYFKQLRPGEKISLVCVANNKTNNSFLSINDRDIKDTNIKYATYNDKLTTFEKTSIGYKWGQAIIYLVNLVFVIVFMIICITDYIDKRKTMIVLWIIIWLGCLIYTFLLPIRWLL